jgi:hypothetical protein
MPSRRTVVSAALTSLFLGGAAALLLSPQALAQSQQELPPISWVCPMPQDDVNEAGPGRCPICGMDLIPVRLDLAYSCPNHPAVITDKPGLCPLDRRELVQVIVALHWECDANPGERFTEPGPCGPGERRLVRELRAHGDHNPRHGGLFYMAADSWHHLEGTYPSQGMFRLFFYDNFTKAIPADKFSGRVLVLNQQNQEIGSAPLTLSGDRSTLEARVQAGPPPVRLAAMVNLAPNTPEQRFDFPLTEYSREPEVAPAAPARPSTTSSAPAPKPSPPAASAAPPAATPQATAPAPAAAAPAPAAAAASPPASAPPAAAPPVAPVVYGEALTSCAPDVTRTDVLLSAERLPSERGQLLTLLHQCSEEVRKLIDAGAMGFVYQPTMLGKDIGLALEGHLNSLTPQQRRVAADAIRRLTLGAWRLDLYGDLGNLELLREAYGHFSDAIEDLEGAYGSQQ